MNFITSCWKRWNLRRACAGDIGAMNRLYLLNDPWKLSAPEEMFRFEESTRIIREDVGRHFGRILEVGCGEGRQTKHLAPLAERIVGLDPSAIAIKRARASKIGNALFEVGDFMTCRVPVEGRFDLVTACEILYYIQDLERAFERLNVLGRRCVVTYYQGAFERLDSFFATKSVKFRTIERVPCKWRVAYWEQTR